MSYYELFEQGPAVFIPVLLVSLIITILAYGAFPFIFAKTRNTPITKKKYKRLCYVINFVVAFVFGIIRGGVIYNFLPYLFWTWIFTDYGMKILVSRDTITY